VTSGRELDRIFEGEDAAMARMVASPDGNRLLAADVSGAAVIWDRTAGRVMARLNGLHGFTVLSPDGRRVVAQAKHKSEGLWLWPDIERPSPIRLPEAFLPVVFSPDGRELATADETGPGIRLWDANTGRELPQRYRLSSLGRAWALAYGTDGRRLAALTAAGVEMFEPTANSPAAVLPIPPLTVASPVSLYSSPNDQMLVLRWTSIDPRHVAVWDLSATPPENVTDRLVDKPYEMPLYSEPGQPHHGCPVFTHDGTGVLADVSGQRQLRLLATHTLMQRMVFTLPEGTLNYTTPVFSPDGRLLTTTVTYVNWCLPPDLTVLWSAAKSLSLPVEQRWATCVFDVATGKRLAVLPGQETERPSRIQFAADGSVQVATLTPNPESNLVVRTWALPTGRPPLWLLAVTAAGLWFVVADWRRGRRRLAST
jgi:WD40 repeat protein